MAKDNTGGGGGGAMDETIQKECSFFCVEFHFYV